MNCALFLARRLSLSGDGHKKTPAVKVAIAAVALSVAVMIAAVSIVFGFKQQIKDKVVGFNSHITIQVKPMSPDEDNILTLTPTLSEIIHNSPFVTDAALQLSMPVILKTPSDFKGVYLKSANSPQFRKFLSANIHSGTIPDFSSEDAKNKIVISKRAADQLGLKTGDKIDTYFLSSDVRVRRLEIAGIFNSHFDSYDEVYAYGSLALMQKLNNLSENQGSALSISTDNFDNLSQNTILLTDSIMHATRDGRLYKFYTIDNALNMGAGYFTWLNLLDMNVIVILVLMTFVACVTLISGMLIIILDNKRFIGLIRSLGAPVKMVRKIFVYMALRVGGIGLLIGNILTICFLYLQERYHFIPLDPDSYYIDFVPVRLTWESVLILNVAIILIIYLVLILPSWFVAKISPSETLRYE